MTWISTYTGKGVDFVSPSPDSIDIEDVAHHLSMVNRYSGATQFPYSVAQHSVLVSYMVPEEHAFAGLMHDATEAYLGDVSTPLKRLLPEYRAIESKFWSTISAKYGLEEELPAAVKDADRVILIAEGKELLPTTKPWWGEAPEGLVLPTIESWTPEEAKYIFLNRFSELYNKNKKEVDESINEKVLPRVRSNNRMVGRFRPLRVCNADGL